MGVEGQHARLPQQVQTAVVRQVEVQNQRVKGGLRQSPPPFCQGAAQGDVHIAAFQRKVKLPENSFVKDKFSKMLLELVGIYVIILYIGYGFDDGFLENVNAKKGEPLSCGDIAVMLYNCAGFSFLE